MENKSESPKSGLHLRAAFCIYPISKQEGMWIMAEEKVRFQMRISTETDAKIKAAMALENCQSQNEFVEKALRFYSDYLVAGDCTAILPPIYLSALRGTIQNTENRTAVREDVWRCSPRSSPSWRSGRDSPQQLA